MIQRTQDLIAVAYQVAAMLRDPKLPRTHDAAGLAELYEQLADALEPEERSDLVTFAHGFARSRRLGSPAGPPDPDGADLIEQLAGALDREALVLEVVKARREEEREQVARYRAALSQLPPHWRPTPPVPRILEVRYPEHTSGMIRLDEWWNQLTAVEISHRGSEGRARLTSLEFTGASGESVELLYAPISWISDTSVTVAGLRESPPYEPGAFVEACFEFDGPGDVSVFLLDSTGQVGARQPVQVGSRVVGAVWSLVLGPQDCDRLCALASQREATGERASGFGFTEGAHAGDLVAEATTRGLALLAGMESPYLFHEDTNGASYAVDPVASSILLLGPIRESAENEGSMARGDRRFTRVQHLSPTAPFASLRDRVLQYHQDQIFDMHTCHQLVADALVSYFSERDPRRMLEGSSYGEPRYIPGGGVDGKRHSVGLCSLSVGFDHGPQAMSSGAYFYQSVGGLWRGLVAGLERRTPDYSRSICTLLRAELLDQLAELYEWPDLGDLAASLRLDVDAGTSS